MTRLDFRQIDDPHHPLARAAFAIEAEHATAGWDGPEPFYMFNLYQRGDKISPNVIKPFWQGHDGVKPRQLLEIYATMLADPSVRGSLLAAMRDDLQSWRDAPGDDVMLHGIALSTESWMVVTADPAEVEQIELPLRKHPERIEIRQVFAYTVTGEFAVVVRIRRKGEHVPRLATDFEWSGPLENLMRTIARRQRWLLDQIDALA